MTNYFVDSTTGDDGDSGLSMDLAFATVKFAVEGAIGPGDNIWIRRLHSEAPTSLITVAQNGQANAPIRIAGWPRAADASISSATWTQGSTTVDLIVGLSMVRESHLGRFITGPDSNDYLITLLTDTDTITIDREYPSTTVTSTDGAATIKADEWWADDMFTEYSITDTGWTINEAAWDADSDDLPFIDFSGGNYYWHFGAEENVHTMGIDFVAGTGYLLYNSGVCWNTGFRGILCLGAPSDSMLRSAGHTWIDRCIFVGSGGGGGSVFKYPGNLYLRNSAAYNFVAACFLQLSGSTYVENFNFNVEVSNTAHLFNTVGIGWNFRGKDIKFGGTGDFIRDTTTMVYMPSYEVFDLGIENYGKVLGAHKGMTHAGELTKVDVQASVGDPEKRTGGADSVIELFNWFDDINWGTRGITEKLTISPVFIHEFEASTASKSYRYYIQAEEAVTAANLWLECEYVSAYGTGTSEYYTTKVTSDEAIAQRADETDWSQYIEVTNIVPAVAGTVRVKCYCMHFSTTEKIYIDPLVVIS